MRSESEKIKKAIMVLKKIERGIDPLTGKKIEGDTFIKDARVRRCFKFVIGILDKVDKGKYSGKKTDFVITEEQKNNIKLPEEKIGVNKFSRCVNACIDLNKSKKLTGVELNKRLKKMGILSEESIGEGRTKTVVNDNSIKYGFESEKRSYEGEEYEMVVINDKGKKYLIENIESIMDVEM